MTGVIRPPSGSWQVQVRHKGRYVSETLRLRKDADEWARATESRIDRGQEPLACGRTDPVTFSDLIDLHVADMTEVGKAPRRAPNSG